jgi:hypothetical protein
MIYVLVSHGGAAMASLALIIVNSIDMAMYNIVCIHACENTSYQYLALIILVFGIVGFLSSILFILAIDFLVLKEARALNAYLGSTNNK